MASKKPVKPIHIHIEADPLRLKSEEIRARQTARQQQTALKSGDITNEQLYAMLSDLLEGQAILEARLQEAIAHKRT